MLTSRHSLLEEASDAGLLGGSAVALWFLLWDALHGTPLITPSVLGQIFLFGQRHPDVHHADFGAVVLYTGVHFLAFLLLGLVVAVLVRLSAEQAAVRFALLVLFVAFEFCFTVVVNVVSDDAVTLFTSESMIAWVWAVMCGLPRVGVPRALPCQGASTGETRNAIFPL